MSPGVENLFVMLKAAGKTDLYNDMLEQYKNPALKLSYKDLKEAVADALFELTRNFSESKKELLSRKKDIKNTIKESSANIRKIAQETLKEVKELCGLQNIKY